MRLDLTPLDDAIAQLEEAIDYHGSALASRDPALKLHLRAAAIQAFEFTYELSFKMLKRHLEHVSSNPAELDKMSFKAIMREAFRRGLIQSEVSMWDKVPDAARHDQSHLQRRQRRRWSSRACRISFGRPGFSRISFSRGTSSLGDAD